MPSTRGKNLTYLRSSNQGAVIKTLLVNRQVSRQMLAQKLNLTKMSISYLTGDLLEKGIIEETPPAQGTVQAEGPGRKPLYLTLRGNSIHALGIYVSRDALDFSVSNIGGEVLDHVRVPLGADTTKTLLTTVICAQVQALLAAHRELNFLGIGLASIGLVDTSLGKVVSTTGFHGIADWDVKSVLEKQFPLPVYLVEDMKSATLAESFYGIARGMTDFVYLGVTNGIGAGVIINESLFEGVRGLSSEIGHTSINIKGKKCTCGNTGCMELYLSVPVLLQKARLDTWDEFLAYCERDVTNPILEQYIREMGIALTNIINIFDPEAVVIGHEGATLGSYCFEKLQIQVDSQAITRRAKEVKILPSNLNQQIPYLGPSSIVYSQLFQGVLQV